MYHRPSTSAGDASIASPIVLTCSSSNVGPGLQHERLAFVVGEEHLAVDARLATPRIPPACASPSRDCHIVFPVLASKQVAMLCMSLTM